MADLQGEIRKGGRRVSIAEANIDDSSTPLWKIVLTGGPCGGKTTALARLSSYLRERRFEVITTPEAWGILVQNGFDYEYFSIDGMPTVVQETTMELQIAMEDGFSRVSRGRGKPAVLLCDRGLMDGSVYMPAEEWDALLEKRGIESVCELREGRYNAVFHLVTAAMRAEKYYTLENNEVRTETPEQAREVDLSTQRAWVGHPNLLLLDNSTDFEGKLQRLVNATARLVGLPSSLERVTKKFVLRGKQPEITDFPEDVKVHLFDVEKVYLYDEAPQEKSSEYSEVYSFVRKRTHVGKHGERGTVYGITTAKITKDGQTIEVKRIINAREYATAFKTRDPTRHIVRQTRMSFLYKNQSFTIHSYSEPISGLCILHAQTESELVSGVELPPFLDVDRQLNDTKEDQERYGAFNISVIRN